MELSRMVVKRDGKFYVRNHDDTKDLGGPYDTEDEANKRLGQIEYFKHQRTEPEMIETLSRSSLSLGVGDATGRTLEGIAVPWDRPTLVQDTPRGPKYLEAFAPQSCDRTCSQHPNFPVFEGHDPRTRPLGVVTFSRSDSEHATMFSAPLSRTKAADEILELVNDGAMRSVSVQFVPKVTEPRLTSGGQLQYRTEVALRHLAIAPTGYGQYEEAGITAVRSEIGNDPGGLMQAVDAALDAAQEALDAHNLGQAQALINAAQASIDACLCLFGLVDADDPELAARTSLEFEDVLSRIQVLRAASPVEGTPVLTALQRRRSRAPMELPTYD